VPQEENRARLWHVSSETGNQATVKEPNVNVLGKTALKNRLRKGAPAA